MVPVARTEGIWLECASIECDDRGRLARLLSALTGPGHDRRLVVEDFAA
jgi:hypothetical protein